MGNGTLSTGGYRVLLLAMFISIQAHAKDAGHGLVTMGGEIVETPCGLDNDSLDQTVDFGLHTVKEALRVIPDSRREFVIHLTNCELASTVKPGYFYHKVNVTFNGLADSADASLLGVSGEAQGIAIQLQDINGIPISLGEPSADYELLNGDNTLHLGALLKTHGNNVQAGEFHSLAQFVLSYL